MVKTIEYISSKFPANHPNIIQLLTSRLFKIDSFNEECAKTLGNCLKHILKYAPNEKNTKKNEKIGIR